MDLKKVDTTDSCQPNDFTIAVDYEENLHLFGAMKHDGHPYAMELIEAVSTYIDSFPTHQKGKTVKIVAEAIDNLPEDSRTVISLMIMDELQCNEIAEVLGITESKVIQLYKRGSGILFMRLKEFSKSQP